jgi:hypothetical protein
MADIIILYKVFIRDIYNKVKRKVIERTGKAPGELGYKPLLK